MTVDKPQHNRFKDAPWYPQAETHLLVGGAGGIGSWLSLLLARAGFIPVIYDFDLLEEHNLGGQLYPKQQIGKPKVEALQSIIKSFSGEDAVIFNEKMDSNTPTNWVAFSAFDNMKARQEMFNQWLTYCATPASNAYNENSIFIDGRLTAEQMQIFCVRASDPAAIATYSKEYLFDDSEVEDAPCTMKQTSHAAAMIASHMVGFFTNHFTNIVEKDTTRTIPFFWQYFIPMDLIEVQQP